MLAGRAPPVNDKVENLRAVIDVGYRTLGVRIGQPGGLRFGWQWSLTLQHIPAAMVIGTGTSVK